MILNDELRLILRRLDEQDARAARHHAELQAALSSIQAALARTEAAIVQAAMDRRSAVIAEVMMGSQE